MKFFLHIFLFALLVGSCNEQKTDSNQNILLLGRLLQLVKLSGTAKGPGTLASAKVEVILMPSDGLCVKNGKAAGAILGTTTTDSSGKYTLSYIRQDAPVCVVITPDDSSTMLVSYSGKKVSWKGNVNMFSILNEPSANSTVVSNGRSITTKTANVTPFTRISAVRTSGLLNIQKRELELSLWNRAVSKVSPSNFTRATVTNALDQANKETCQSFFAKVKIDGNNLDEYSTESTPSKLREGGLMSKIDTLSGKGEIDPAKGESLMSFMADDFSDGKFDGKKMNSSGLTESIPVEELSSLGISGTVADNFLKSEFTSYIKDYAALDPEIGDNAWKSVSFCDSDTDNCDVEIPDLAIYSYPADGDTYVSTYPIVVIGFSGEMDTSTLTVQATGGACTGTIQISLNNFSTCIGGILDSSDNTYISFDGWPTKFIFGATYKLKVKNTVKLLTGDSLLTSDYTMSTGFAIVPSQFVAYGTPANTMVYDQDNGLLWTKCPVGLSGADCTTGTATSAFYCDINDNSCNGSVDDGILDVGNTNTLAFDICDNLTTGGFNWQVADFDEAGYLLAGRALNSVLFDIMFFPTFASFNYWTNQSIDVDYAFGFNATSGLIPLAKDTTPNIKIYCVSYDLQ